MLVLRYKYSKELADLEKALPHLEKSVEYYKQLVELTQNSYLYANSMQTKQRRIPIAGDEGKNKTWEELLPHYQEELAKFKNNIQILLSSNDSSFIQRQIKPFTPVQVKILNADLSFFPIEKNEKVYSDKDYEIIDFAEELKNLSAIKLSFEKQKEEGTVIHFKNEKPVKVLVGYYNGHSWKILPPPALETDASANNRGQADIKIANAISIPGLYPVNIYSYSFSPGENTLELGKGIVLILGFMDGEQEIIFREAGYSVNNNIEGIDWLFY
ncbi:hypothetical protein ACFLTE_09365, partial [Bacteroidota bacterium]